MYDHLRGVSQAMNALGWENYASDHEDANGQFEQNFAFADAMTTADRVISARYLISVLAEQADDRDVHAQALHRPHRHRDVPTCRCGAMAPRCSRAATAKARGRQARSFLGGVLRPRTRAAGGPRAHRQLLQAHRGSLDAFGRDVVTAAPATAATTAPTCVPDADRTELRGGDGAANPYLALAAALAAGLDGIARDADPDTGTDRLELPPTLLHAMDALEADPFVSLDAAGPGVAAYFAGLKREEFSDWHAQVGSWEVDRYLTAF